MEEGNHLSSKETGTIQSVRRALTLLGLFTPVRSVWSVGDLTRASGLHKSVVTRLMATMALEGFVIQDVTTRAYSIGPQAFAVGSSYEPYNVLHQVTRPLMDELTMRSGHSTALGVPAGHRFVIIDTLESSNSIRVAFSIGERPHYHGAAIGKVLLAALPEEEVRQIVGRHSLPAITKHTIIDTEILVEELKVIRKTGVAMSRQESIVGVDAVAAPVTNRRGECVAGISVVYPSHVVTENEVANLVGMTVEYAARASERIGILALPQHISQQSRSRRNTWAPTANDPI